MNTIAERTSMPDEPSDGEWRVLGSITIDSGMVLLIDPIHGGADVGEFDESDFAQIPIPGGDFSAMAVVTGIGDGRYTVAGRYVDCLFGRRIAEIRVQFLNAEGDYLGGDEEGSRK